MVHLQPCPFQLHPLPHPPLQGKSGIPGQREAVESTEEGLESREERPVGEETDTLVHVQRLLRVNKQNKRTTNKTTNYNIAAKEAVHQQITLLSSNSELC